jgi:PAS domain S-box-containing protein
MIETRATEVSEAMDDREEDKDRGRPADGMALQILARAPFSIVLTDPTVDDNPIVYVNDAFERATGYSRAGAIGRNCRFLQGEETDRRAVQRLATRSRRRRRSPSTSSTTGRMARRSGTG